MPVSIVVGGQYGSEGKGKIALELAKRENGNAVVVRVGGPNSGHTGFDRCGKRWVLRQLPAAALHGSDIIVLPAGSFIDADLLLEEMQLLGIEADQVALSPNARVIGEEAIAWERNASLIDSIGSTGAGTGAAVLAAVARGSIAFPIASRFARDDVRLSRLLRPTGRLLRQKLEEGRRVIVEGTQGFGLSLLHSPHWPNVTSRDTTASGFLAEAGLSPFDVDDVTLVIRSNPIRVSGASGPLEHEIDWETVTREAASPRELKEMTSVTKKVRRVGRFEFEIVKRAIEVNRPTRIVLNHLDHVDWECNRSGLSQRARKFIRDVENGLGTDIDWVGTGEQDIVELHPTASLRTQVA